METRKQLEEMGFAPKRIEAAMRNTSGELEAAVQWIEENQERFDKADAQKFDDDPSVSADTSGHAEAAEKVENAENLENAPERKLTEEEKAAKLQALREKAALRKAEQAKQDAIERRRNEELMMKRDRDYRQIAEEQKQKEAMKEAEKRRLQAREDALAKKKILAQIDSDKKARQQAKSIDKPTATEPERPKPQPRPAQPRPDYIVSNLRFRLPGQPAPYTETYPVDVPVKDVIDDVSTRSGIPASRIVLMLTFPTRKISLAQGEQSLKEAGLINTNVMVKEE